MPSAAEECCELSGKYHGIVREFCIVWRVVSLVVSIVPHVRCASFISCSTPLLHVFLVLPLLICPRPLEVSSADLIWLTNQQADQLGSADRLGSADQLG